MAALPLLLTQSEGLHPPIRLQPQRPPPPRQPKPAVADPAELVTCDQTIERRIAYVKVGRHVRIAAGDLDAFIQAGRVDVGELPTLRRGA
jgi:hypothetical protein